MQHIIVRVINFTAFPVILSKPIQHTLLFVSADSWHPPVKWQRFAVAANIAVESSPSFSSAGPNITVVLILHNITTRDYTLSGQISPHYFYTGLLLL
jgi:hypothetical protein